MTNGWQPPLAEVPIDDALTLVVVSRARRELTGYVVDLRNDAEGALRQACARTLEDLEESDAVPFGPDVYLGADEYLAVPEHVVGEDHPVLDLLAAAGAMDQLAADDIPRLWFYAALVGNEPENRTAFIRKVDPHVVAKGGFFLLTLGEALGVIDRPVFIIEERFDVVVLEGGLAVLNLTPFEILFRQADELEARADVWITAISDHVDVDPAGLEILTREARRNSRLAHKVRSIYDRRHLANVQAATIRDAAAARGLDPDGLFNGDTLMITEETDLMALLRLLNEDLFEGALTGQEFAADRKRPL